MYSKCGVAPRMTQPRQMTASNAAGLGQRTAPPAATRTRRERSRLRRRPRARPASSKRRWAPSRKPIGDGLVEPGDHDREAIAGGARERARGVEAVGAHAIFPLNSGLRFSRNARVPSRMSSVLATSPKSVASKRRPSATRHLQALVNGLDDVAHGDRRLARQQSPPARAPLSSAPPPARRG